MGRRIVLPAAVFAFLFAAAAGAQTPTGTVSGHVVDPQGLVVPGVTVTAQSSSLQGTRTAVTSVRGDYVLPYLPPGSYQIAFELTGFGTVREQRNVAGTQLVLVDVTMSPAAITEAVTVVGRSDAFVNTVQAATSLTGATLSILPTTRTMLAAVDLSPAVHGTGPSGNRTISGSMSFENVFMLNGVQITDNIRNTPFGLFIEDAIQEVTTATSGISAEYGRFGGGIVNAITKSGGNSFGGSFRTTLTNDNWHSVSPFGEPKTAKVIPTYEFTIGGPIVKDRTWFFGAGRTVDDLRTRTLGFTSLPYEFDDNEKRFEGKVTQAVGSGRSVKVVYTKINRDQLNNAFPNAAGIMDLRSLTDRALPQDLFSVNYTGTVKRDVFVEGQVSSRHFTFAHDGATTTDLINGTVITDRARGERYWSPTFCGVCVDEGRNNTEVLAKGTYFLSSRHGAHNIVFGYDTFNDIRIADNHQSGSDYTVAGTTSVIRDGVVYPVFNSGDRTTFIQYNPIFLSSLGTSFRTHSLFVNDGLRYNQHLSFSLGLRWDKNHGVDAGGALVAQDSAFSPRLGLVWDPKGDGRWAVTASYSKYVAAIANSIADAGSPGGRPATFTWNYAGPAINQSASGALVTPDQALRVVFDWFNSVGGTKLRPFRSNPTIPGVTTKINGSLDSPNVMEYAGGVSRQLGGRGTVRADFTYRDYRDFYATVTNLSTGRVTDSEGQSFDFSVVDNTNAVKRRYAGLAIQSNYRFGDRLDVSGNYTLSRLWGSINGENIGSGPIRTGVLAYPEYFDVAWNNPEGDLAADQRHRVRLWATYRTPIAERHGSLSLSAIEIVQSGTPYGASGTVDTTTAVANPGYLTPPATVTYFFTARDAFHADAQVRTDLAVNYAFKLPGGSQRELFFQAQLLNVFNRFQLIDVQGGNIDTSVLARTNNASYQTFNPFTTTPVRGVNWDYAPSFGQALSADAYTVQRTFRMNFGVRF